MPAQPSARQFILQSLAAASDSRAGLVFAALTRRPDLKETEVLRAIDHLLDEGHIDVDGSYYRWRPVTDFSASYVPQSDLDSLSQYR